MTPPIRKVLVVTHTLMCCIQTDVYNKVIDEQMKRNLLGVVCSL